MQSEINVVGLCWSAQGVGGEADESGPLGNDTRTEIGVLD